MSRNTVLTIADVLLVLLLSMFVLNVAAEPTHKASGEGVEIVIHSDKCAFKEIVGNLPFRATWTEKGKTYEGCGGVNNGVAVFYFTDKTVVVIPAQYFVRVVGA